MDEISKNVNRLIAGVLKSHLNDIDVLKIVRHILELYCRCGGPVAGVMPPQIIYNLLVSQEKFMNCLLFPASLNMDQERNSSVTDSNITDFATPEAFVKMELCQLLRTLFAFRCDASQNMPLAPTDIESNNNLISVLLASYNATNSKLDQAVRDLLFAFRDGDEDEGDDQDLDDDCQEVVSYDRKWGPAGLTFLASRIAGTAVDAEVCHVFLFIFSFLLLRTAYDLHTGGK